MALIPVQAVGGAAGAVGGMADSGVVVRMTRGRIWIGVLAVLLGGIVALNVWGLGLSASTSATSTKIDELERANSVLKSKIAKRSSSDRVQALVAGLGLETPTPKAVRYLKSRNGDVAAAAERLGSGQVSVLDGLPIAPAFAGETPTAATGELATTEAAPAPAPETADPAAAAPATTDPATAADPAAAPSAGSGTAGASAGAAPSTGLDGGVTP